MRILNDASNELLANVSIFLTKKELQVLRGDIEHLINAPICEHIHFMDDDYEREMTIASYSEDGKNTFAVSVNELLEKG